MLTFRYKAITADGKPANGVIDAEDRARAEDRLRNRGLTRINVTVAKLPGKKRTYVHAAPKGRSHFAILLLLVFLLGALVALIYYDPYGWIGLFPKP